MDEIRHGEHAFTRADALRLCINWQDLEWGTPHRHTRDNIENAIEDLCLAWGFTVDEVRATWVRNRDLQKSATEK